MRKKDKSLLLFVALGAMALVYIYFSNERLKDKEIGHTEYVMISNTYVCPKETNIKQQFENLFSDDKITWREYSTILSYCKRFKIQQLLDEVKS